MPPFSGTTTAEDNSSATATNSGGGYYNYQSQPQQQQYHHQAKQQLFFAVPPPQQQQDTTTIQIVPTAGVAGSSSSPLPPLPVTILEQQRPPIIGRRSSYYQTTPANYNGRLTSITEDKAVRFQPTIQVHEILHSNDYTDNEYDATWYSYQELQTIQAEVSQIARKMNNSSFNTDNSSQKKLFNYDTIRGIEERTTFRVRLTHQNRLTALYTVLHEQHKQRKYGKGTDSTVTISDLYQSVTINCKQAAIDMAMIDAHEAQKELISTSNSSSDPYDAAAEQDDEKASPALNDCLGGLFSFFSMLLKTNNEKINKSSIIH